MNINMNEVPATFPEMVEAMSEAERARERVRDLQPVFCVKPSNEMRHDQSPRKLLLSRRLPRLRGRRTVLPRRKPKPRKARRNERVSDRLQEGR